MLELGIVACFGLGGWNSADGFEQASMVEPVDPFQRSELDGFQASPGAASPDHLGLVEAIDGLGEGIIIAVANAANRRLNAGPGQSLGVLDRDILGRFKRSSQHPDEGGCDKEAEAAFGSVRAGCSSIARPTGRGAA